MARKRIYRKAKEPRGTFQPKWVPLSPNTRVLNETPHTAIIAEPGRKVRVFRKSDISISPLFNLKEYKGKRTLADFAACKTQDGYARYEREKRNRLHKEKLRLKRLESKRRAQTPAKKSPAKKPKTQKQTETAPEGAKQNKRKPPALRKNKVAAPEDEPLVHSSDEEYKAMQAELLQLEREEREPRIAEWDKLGTSGN